MPPGNEHAIRVATAVVRWPHLFPPRAVAGHALTLPFALAGHLWTRRQQEALLRYAAAGGDVDRLRRCRTVTEVFTLTDGV